MRFWKKMSGAEVSNEITNIQEFLNREKLFFEKNYGQKIEYNISPNDFESLILIGVGSFGRVYLAQKKETKEYYAMKVMIKRFLIKHKQIEHTLSEKLVLECMRCPFTIKLTYFCKSNSFLYFILPFVPGGEIFNQLRMLRLFTEEQAKFYAAQVLLGLEYLHHLDLIYRDLKPENLLIDNGGYIKIADFGFCKLVRGRTYTLCGTPDYIAPEIILNKGYGKTVDYWSYGVMVYEFCSGYPPFIAPDLIRLYESITSGNYSLYSSFSKELKDFLKKLLEVDVSRRYGNLKNGVEDIKNHKWFKKINWLAMVNRKVEAPFKPDLSGPDDTHYFDTYFEPNNLRESDVDSFPDEFADF